MIGHCLYRARVSIDACHFWFSLFLPISLVLGSIPMHLFPMICKQAATTLFLHGWHSRWAEAETKDAKLVQVSLQLFKTLSKQHYVTTKPIHPPFHHIQTCLFPSKSTPRPCRQSGDYQILLANTQARSVAVLLPFLYNRRE